MTQIRDMYPELAPSLRQLAQNYFNGEPVDHESGICLALKDYMFDPYNAMGDLMEYLGFKGAYFGPCHKRRENWEPRAYMCLLLAEYLEAA